MVRRNVIELLTSDVSARTQWRVVRITRPDGRQGIGEASDSGVLGDAIGVLSELEQRTAAVAASATAEPGEIRAWADEAVASVPDSRFARAVVGGVEQALCDLHARSRNQSVAQWAAERPHDTADGIRCYANVNRVPGGRAPSDVAAAARSAIDAGFGSVKCAPFDAPDNDRPIADVGLRRIEAVRDAIGPDAELLVDCHLRLPIEQVVTMLPALRELRVGWLEDAVAIDDLDGLRRLREHTDVRLAGGEFSHRPEPLHAAIEQGLLDVLLLDVKHAGGITRALRLAEHAHAAGDVTISPHNPTGPVGTAASVQFLLAVSGTSGPLELAVGEADWRPDLVQPPEAVTGGRLAVRETPGLGVTLSDRQDRVSVAWSSRAEVTS